MFESLADQIKHDNRERHSAVQRLLEWSISLIVAAVVFGGLYVAIHLFQP